MAKRSRSARPAAPGPAARLSNEVLIELLDATRASLARANGRAEVQYAAALAELELEAARRGLEPGPSAQPAPAAQPDVVDRPEDHIPRLDLVLHAGSETAVLEELAELGPDDMYHAWQVARAIPEPPLRLSRLTTLCLVLDRRVFGEETAEQRHRSYALFPAPVDARLQVVNEAIAATFVLLRMRTWS